MANADPPGLSASRSMRTGCVFAGPVGGHGLLVAFRGMGKAVVDLERLESYQAEESRSRRR